MLGAPLTPHLNLNLRIEKVDYSCPPLKLYSCQVSHIRLHHSHLNSNNTMISAMCPTIGHILSRLINLPMLIPATCPWEWLIPPSSQLNLSNPPFVFISTTANEIVNAQTPSFTSINASKTVCSFLLSLSPLINRTT